MKLRLVERPWAESGADMVEDLGKVRDEGDEGEAKEKTECAAELSNKGRPGVD